VTRKRLSLLVGVLGFFAAAASLVLLLAMGSIFADARTEKITGPGVDVFVRTPFPTEGSTVVLEVEARGGSRTGVQSIIVTSAGLPLVQTGGTGSFLASKGRSRGADSELVTFRLPSGLRAGDTLKLQIDVDFVVGQRRSYTNENKHGRVFLDLAVYSSSGRLWAQLARVMLACGCFLIWLVVVWGVAKLYAKVGDDHVDAEASEAEGIGLLMGFMGGSIVGYWLFAFRITNALEISSTLVTVGLMMFWCVAPLVLVWRWWKRRKNHSELPAARVVAR
jgi:hypothetical protein